MQLLSDPEVAAHQETAGHMTSEQQQDKLEELQALRTAWRNAHAQQPAQEQTTILKVSSMS